MNDIEDEENVLVIPKTLLNLANGFVEDLTASELLHGTIPESPAFFMPRARAEEDEDHLQVIPYVVLMSGMRVLCYERNGGEARLHAKLSVGIGGHINDRDNSEEPFTAYVAGTIRELQEEVGLMMTPDSLRGTLMGFMTDNASPVGRVHLGFLHVITLNNMQAELILGNCERAMLGPRWVDLLELSDPDVNLEAWSRLAVDHLVEKMTSGGKCSDPSFQERGIMLTIALSNAASAMGTFIMQDNVISHMAARKDVEMCMGRVVCLMSGMNHNGDISLPSIQQHGERFLEVLRVNSKHQNFQDNGKDS